jgi:hypothetical protein
VLEANLWHRGDYSFPQNSAEVHKSRSLRRPGRVGELTRSWVGRYCTIWSELLPDQAHWLDDAWREALTASVLSARPHEQQTSTDGRDEWLLGCFIEACQAFE